MRYIFIVIFIVFSNYLYSQQETMSGYKDDREISNLKGNIKKIVSYQYKAVEKSLKIEKSDFIDKDLSFYIVYDKNRNIFEEGSYEKENKKLSYIQNKYKDNSLIKSISYNSANKIIEFSYYKYDKSKKLIETLFTDNKNKSHTKISYYYKDGKITLEQVYDFESNTSEKFEYKYDKNNNLIKQEREIFRNQKHKIILSYDNKNIVSKVEEIAGNKNLGFYYYYNTKKQLNKFNIKWLHDNTEMSDKIYYNENGDIIKISTTERDNKKSETTYKYKYDKNKNWIERLEYKNGVCDNMVIRTFTYY